MRDRTPTRVLNNGALRYAVYDEAGNFLRHDYLLLADEPSDPGTDLSKATLLQDSTETALFGSAADRTVDDAFAGIAAQLKLIKDDMATITLTLQDSAGHTLPGVLVQGILSESGQAVYSGTDGVAAGYIAEGNTTVKVTGYADIVDFSEVIPVTKGTTITKTLTLTTRNFFKITSSGKTKFSGNVQTVDITTVGAGGGGNYITSTNAQGLAGAGGGGGYCVLTMDVAVDPNTEISGVIGAGGSVGETKGSDGGSTSVKYLSDGESHTITAEGGKGATTSGGVRKGGIGNGNGGDGTPTTHGTAVWNGGDPGTVLGYADYDTLVRYGGGGAGGRYLNKASSPDTPDTGKDFGATSWTVAAQANTGGGSSGAMWGRDSDGTYYDALNEGKPGANGIITFRLHLKSAA